MNVKEALERVKQFEEDKQRLYEKKADIEAKKSEIQAKLKETEDELSKLLVKQALGELKDEGEKRISSLEKEAERIRRELRAVELAVQELQRRLSEMDKIPNKAYLMLFAARRDQALKFVREKVEEHRMLALQLGALEKAINLTLSWLHRWETALAEDLASVGLEGKRALKDLGPVLHSKRLDSTIYLFDLEKREIKSFEELWQAPDSTVPVLWEGLSFLENIPFCLNLGSPADLRKCAWRHIKEGLGLNSDENQRKEEE